MTAILYRSVRERIKDPYGEGFWSERFAFLDYPASRYQQVQERLLAANLSELGLPAVRLNQFQRTTPLAEYGSYVPALAELRRSRRGRRFTWVYDRAVSGEERWTPYTQRALRSFSGNLITAIGTASAVASGEPDIQPGDRAIYHVPPGPDIAGLGAFELGRRFGLRGVIEAQAPGGAVTTAATSEGVDLVISTPSRFSKLGRRLNAAADVPTGSSYEKPGLPVLVGWGAETTQFRAEIESAWGQSPFGLYASPEAGCLGIQYGIGRGIALCPDSCLFEFLPERETDSVAIHPQVPPETALLSEVAAGERYELVVTSFHGMPFVRYRTGHVVKFSKGELGFGPDLEYAGKIADQIEGRKAS